MENLGNRIISSVGGVEKRIFETAAEADKYIAEKIKNAKDRVYDLNWQDSLSDDASIKRDNEERQRSQEAINNSIKAFCSETQPGSKKKKDTLPLAYKEIFTFPNPSRINALKEHIQLGNIYQCAYYDYDNTKKEEDKKRGEFPKLQFVIIDEEEVIFVSSLYKPNLCAIKDKRIVFIFTKYFDQAWELSKKIKEEDTAQKVINEIISDIETKYTPKTKR